MKRLIFTMLALIFASQIKAQSTTASNVYSPGSFLGYIQNNALNFRTNNTNRMKLNSNVTYSINGSNAGRSGYFYTNL